MAYLRSNLKEREENKIVSSSGWSQLVDLVSHHKKLEQ